MFLLSHRRSIQAMRQKLDRQRASDNLKKNLEHRPERDELVDRRFSSSISTYVLALGYGRVLFIY